MYETVLVPTDGSDVSERAAREAFELAERLDATVHVLFVIDESASSFLLTTDTMSKVLSILQEEGERAVDDAASLAGTDTEVVQSIVRGMSIHSAIVEYAEDNDVDLVVMGTRGRHGVEHLLGSTTERVLTNTGIPVLVVGGKNVAGEE